MSTVDDQFPVAPGTIHWLDDDETETLKEVVGDNVPKYLLPERSLIETAINDLRSHYVVPVNQEAELDRLVFSYNTAVAAATAAVKRWQAERGLKRYALHAMLYLEQPEVVACIESLQELEVAGRTLFEFLSGLQAKGHVSLPDFMRQWEHIGQEPARFDRR